MWRPRRMVSFSMSSYIRKNCTNYHHHISRLPSHGALYQIWRDRIKKWQYDFQGQIIAYFFDGVTSTCDEKGGAEVFDQTTTASSRATIPEHNLIKRNLIDDFSRTLRTQTHVCSQEPQCPNVRFKSGWRQLESRTHRAARESDNKELVECNFLA